MDQLETGRGAVTVFNRTRTFIDAVGTVVIATVAIMLVVERVRTPTARQAPKVAAPSTAEDIRGGHWRGSPTARVVVIEYSDFECPFCGRFVKDTLPTLTAKYVAKGDVALVFRNLPLTVHPRAREAAVAAECASQQGRFWELHDQLFRTAPNWDVAALAKGAGVDMGAWTECTGGAGKVRVAADEKHAHELGVVSTPVFLIGTPQSGGAVKVTDVIEGAQPVSEFEKILDRLLRG